MDGIQNGANLDAIRSFQYMDRSSAKLAGRWFDRTDQVGGVGSRSSIGSFGGGGGNGGDARERSGNRSARRKALRHARPQSATDAFSAYRSGEPDLADRVRESGELASGAQLRACA